MRQDAESSRNSVFLPFILGGIAGAVAGLLLAPRSGSDTRKQLKDVFSGARNKMSSTLEKGIDLYGDARIALTSAVEAGKQAYITERQKVQSDSVVVSD